MIFLWKLHVYVYVETGHHAKVETSCGNILDIYVCVHACQCKNLEKP